MQRPGQIGGFRVNLRRLGQQEQSPGMDTRQGGLGQLCGAELPMGTPMH